MNAKLFDFKQVVILSTQQVHDLRLNENKLKAVLFHSMYRFTNLTDLNLTKNEISYIEDGAFTHQANLQVRDLIGWLVDVLRGRHLIG